MLRYLVSLAWFYFPSKGFLFLHVSNGFSDYALGCYITSAKRFYAISKNVSVAFKNNILFLKNAEVKKVWR